MKDERSFCVNVYFEVFKGADFEFDVFFQSFGNPVQKSFFIKIINAMKARYLYLLDGLPSNKHNLYFA